MNDIFEKDEKLYRAVYPPERAMIFWKSDGTLSHHAFEDPRGLSVERGDYRTDEAVCVNMRRRFQGLIARLYVRDCVDVDALVKYLPSRGNPYHTEIHGSSNTKLLSKHQCLHLAKKATVL